MNRARPYIFRTIAPAAVLAAFLAGGHHGKPAPAPTPAPAACVAPAQWFPEIRVYGQRLEAGIDPVTHGTRTEVTQNSEPGDQRFVVLTGTPGAPGVCLRPLTAAERNPVTP